MKKATSNANARSNANANGRSKRVCEAESFLPRHECMRRILEFILWQKNAARGTALRCTMDESRTRMQVGTESYLVQVHWAGDDGSNNKGVYALRNVESRRALIAYGTNDLFMKLVANGQGEALCAMAITILNIVAPAFYRLLDVWQGIDLPFKPNGLIFRQVPMGMKQFLSEMEGRFGLGSNVSPPPHAKARTPMTWTYPAVIAATAMHVLLGQYCALAYFGITLNDPSEGNVMMDVTPCERLTYRLPGSSTLELPALPSCTSSRGMPVRIAFVDTGINITRRSEEFKDLAQRLAQVAIWTEESVVQVLPRENFLDEYNPYQLMSTILDNTRRFTNLAAIPQAASALHRLSLDLQAKGKRLQDGMTRTAVTPYTRVPLNLEEASLVHMYMDGTGVSIKSDGENPYLDLKDAQKVMQYVGSSASHSAYYQKLGAQVGGIIKTRVAALSSLQTAQPPSLRGSSFPILMHALSILDAYLPQPLKCAVAQSRDAVRLTRNV